MTVMKAAFQLVDGWDKDAAAHPKDIVCVAVDSKDRVYLLTRTPHRVVVYSRDGAFLSAWGEGHFTDTHGIAVGPDDSVYVTDYGDHTVRKFSPEGTLLLTLGTPGVPSDTGYDPKGSKTVLRPAGPFNKCTTCAIAPNGDIYVGDGYGNSRIHRFAKDGTLRQSWGHVGVGHGGFHNPHGVAVDARLGRVLVADRQNDLIQVFDMDGGYITEWTDTFRPASITVSPDGRVFVAEMLRDAGGSSFRNGINVAAQPSRVSVFDERGVLTARFDGGLGNKFNGVAVDSRGDLYLSNHRINKFTPSGG